MIEEEEKMAYESNISGWQGPPSSMLENKGAEPINAANFASAPRLKSEIQKSKQNQEMLGHSYNEQKYATNQRIGKSMVDRSVNYKANDDQTIIE